MADVVSEKKTLFGHEPRLRFDVVMADRTYELLAPDDQTKVCRCADKKQPLYELF